MPIPNIQLTPDQIAFFKREGYLAIPAITTSEEVTQLCDIYDHLFEIKAGRDQGDHLDLTTTDEDGQEPALPQILNPSKYAPALRDTVLRANAEAVARQLIGSDTVYRGDHAIRKRARTGSATPWHQDEAYNSPTMAYNEISIWIPLQEATLENGCMHFVPRSHTGDVLPHHPIGNDPRVIGLEVDTPEALAHTSVTCPLSPGGATIHHCKTLHYTGPNLSDGPRRAYILAFGMPPRTLGIPRRFIWLEQQQTKWQERTEEARNKEQQPTS